MIPKLPKLSDIGITPDQSSKWQALTEVSEEEFEQALRNPAVKPSTGLWLNALRPRNHLRIGRSDKLQQALWSRFSRRRVDLRGDPQGGRGQKFARPWGRAECAHSCAQRQSTGNHFLILQINCSRSLLLRYRSDFIVIC